MGKYAEQPGSQTIDSAAKVNVTKVDVDVYKARGLNTGKPGIVEWINSNVNGGVFWALRHVFLALGELDAYKELYGLDPILVEEKVKLEQLKEELEPKVKTQSWIDWRTAMNYYDTGKSNILGA